MLLTPMLTVVVAHTFPLHAEIDLGPLALRVGTAYRFLITVESVAGKKGESKIDTGAAAKLDDLAKVVETVLLGMEKLAVHRNGHVFTVTEFDGSPVRKVTFEFREAGPKPIVRWVPPRK
jgi:hypothetical protein